MVYLDNFFTNSKLLAQLRKQGIGGVGTCKSGSGMSEKILLLKAQAEKGKHWGVQLVETVEVVNPKNDKDRELILCIGWQDNSIQKIQRNAIKSQQRHMIGLIARKS